MTRDQEPEATIARISLEERCRAVHIALQDRIARDGMRQLRGRMIGHGPRGVYRALDDVLEHRGRPGR